MKLYILAVFLLGTLLPGRADIRAMKRLEEVFNNDTYDKTSRPSYYLERPDEVQVTAYVLSMPEVDSTKQEMTLNLYFRQQWIDPRLAIPIGSPQMLPPEDWSKIWQPDTFFQNELSAAEHELTTLNAFLNIYSDGRVHKSTRYTIRFSCPMDFRYFPFDEQRCKLMIESYGHTAKSIVYSWKDNKTSVGIGSTSHMEFKAIAIRLESPKVEFKSDTYSALSMEFLIRRSPGRYLSEFFYPCTFLTVVALLSMFVFEERVAVIISGLFVGFTVLFLAFTTGTMETPFVSYSTALDTYSSITNTFVFLAFLVNILVLLLQKRDSGPETFALSNLTEGRIRLSNDEEANLCSTTSSPNVRQTNILPTKLQSIFNIIANILARLMVFIKLLLIGCYVLTNLIYWSTYPNSSGTSNDDLLNESWRVLE